jgi:hypothetical protein
MGTILAILGSVIAIVFGIRGVYMYVSRMFRPVVNVFETIMTELVPISPFTFVDLVNKTILTFHYCTTLNN